MDVKLLKSKIKSIKDVYRTELQKTEKSKKSGCGTDEVYVPKLSWFIDATYLSEVVTTRSNTSNLDLNQSQNSEQYEEGGDTIDPATPGIANNSTVEANTAHSSGFVKPPEPPRKWFRKNVEIGKYDNGEISQTIKKLDDIANNAAVDKPYDLFGKYVASELYQLPKRAAILLQQDIQNCITRAKLDILDNSSVQQEFHNLSPQSMASATGSSNNDEDILQTAMSNTFSQIM